MPINVKNEGTVGGGRRQTGIAGAPGQIDGPAINQSRPVTALPQFRKHLIAKLSRRLSSQPLNCFNSDFHTEPSLIFFPLQKYKNNSIHFEDYPMKIYFIIIL